ncbi:hypothetical protein D9M68_737300 [compost metagenome]
MTNQPVGQVYFQVRTRFERRKVSALRVDQVKAQHILGFGIDRRDFGIELSSRHGGYSRIGRVQRRSAGAASQAKKFDTAERASTDSSRTR